MIARLHAGRLPASVPRSRPGGLPHLGVELLLGAGVAARAAVPALTLGRLPPLIPVFHIRTGRRPEAASKPRYSKSHPKGAPLIFRLSQAQLCLPELKIYKHTKTTNTAAICL